MKNSEVMSLSLVSSAKMNHCPARNAQPKAVICLQIKTLTKDKNTEKCD